jgi:hypothetical protein
MTKLLSSSFSHNAWSKKARSGQPLGPDEARFTSKADIDAPQTNVRFVPLADI